MDDTELLLLASVVIMAICLFLILEEDDTIY